MEAFESIGVVEPGGDALATAVFVSPAATSPSVTMYVAVQLSAAAGASVRLGQAAAGIAPVPLKLVSLTVMSESVTLGTCH